MTHDELLAKIDYYLVPTKELTGDDKIKNSAIGFMNALRAVVELSKTKGGVGMNDSFNDGWVTAMNTVFQAVEKELA